MLNVAFLSETKDSIISVLTKVLRGETVGGNSKPGNHFPKCKGDCIVIHGVNCAVVAINSPLV